MREIFKGFLLLRLIGFLALLTVVAVVVGVRSISRGADVAGIAVLVGAAVGAGVIGSVVARRASGRRR